MVRSFLDDFNDNKHLLFEAGNKKVLNLLMITGKLMAPVLKGEIAPDIRRKLCDLEIDVLGVENHLIGESITVSGLLCGNDIINDYNRSNLNPDVVMLPPNCINDDGLLLDDHTPKSIADGIRTRVTIGSYDLVGAITEVVKGE